MSQASPSVLAVSSLVPGRTDPRVVQSWQDLGLSVLSVNGPDEAPAVAAQWPDISVCAVSETAARVVGRPLVHVHRMLSEAAAMAGEAGVVILLNADIGLAPEPDTLRIVTGAAANGALVAGVRLDVPADAADWLDAPPPEGAMHSAQGFDVMAMPRALAARVPQGPYALGMPFWDYVIPLWALAAGVPVVKAMLPMARHRLHGVRWERQTLSFNHHFVRSCRGLLSDEPHWQPLRAALEAAPYDDLMFTAMKDVFAPEEERMQAMEALAVHLDGVTSAAVAVIDQAARSLNR